MCCKAVPPPALCLESYSNTFSMNPALIFDTKVRLKNQPVRLIYVEELHGNVKLLIIGQLMCLKVSFSSL